MIDKFDYAEPLCPLSGGKEFYYPDNTKPIGRIDVDRIIKKLDEFFSRNDMSGAKRLLEFWRGESVSLRDREGELSIENELVGLYRKLADKENGLESVKRAMELIEITDQSNTATGATVLLNCATALKSFGYPDEAMPLYLKAEEIYKAQLSPSDPSFGGLYNNMALALADLGRFEEAEKMYLNALGVMENVKNGEPECAVTYINMAHLFEDIGKTEKITECLFKAYSLLNTEGLPHDGNYAFVCEKCAPSFAHFGYDFIYNELNTAAREIYERA